MPVRAHPTLSLWMQGPRSSLTDTSALPPWVSPSLSQPFIPFCQAWAAGQGLGPLRAKGGMGRAGWERGMAKAGPNLRIGAREALSWSFVRDSIWKAGVSGESSRWQGPMSLVSRGLVFSGSGPSISEHLATSHRCLWLPPAFLLHLHAPSHPVRHNQTVINTLLCSKPRWSPPAISQV